jgi:hypothetical protein
MKTPDNLTVGAVAKGLHLSVSMVRRMAEI